MPSYISLFESGELAERAREAKKMLVSCMVCPRMCCVDRVHYEMGECGIGALAMVSSRGPHFGEEDVLVGQSGSGTIFFSGCNLHCRYCQNYDISQEATGKEVGPHELSQMMIDLQGFGCHNVNLVSPTHVVPQILEALEIACMEGLNLPIVYNTGGYDSVETLRLLDGVVDIYMPDMKYSDANVGERLSLVDDYPRINREAVKEMHRQVGDLEVDENGIAVKGLIIRHLVLPNDLAGTSVIAKFLAEEISTETFINVMAQYRPEYRAHQCDGMGRRPTREEYLRAVRAVLDTGLYRLDDRF